MKGLVEKMKYWKSLWDKHGIEHKKYDIMIAIKAAKANIPREKIFSHRKMQDRWYNWFAIPVIEYIQEAHDLEFKEIMGPFGLRSYVFIVFHGGYTIHIEPVFDDEIGWGLRDFSIDTNQYKKGTIGFMNAMNHPIIRASEHVTDYDMAKFIDNNLCAPQSINQKQEA